MRWVTQAWIKTFKVSSEHSAFQSTPVAGAGTRFSTLVSGPSCPVHRVSRMCCFLWKIGRSQRLEQRRWLFRFYLSTKKTAIHPIQSFQAWHSHGMLGESHRAEKCHYFPPLWPSTVCSVGRGWSKGELGTGDRCLLKFSQDIRATRTLFKDVALPVLKELSLLSVLQHQSEAHRCGGVARTATIKLREFYLFKAQHEQGNNNKTYVV